MNRRVLVYVAVLAMVAGCNKKKPQEGTEPPLLPPSSNDVGSGSAKPEPKPDPKLVERGEYLANLVGCKTCHVGVGPTGPDVTKVFAGGLEMPEKFGTWRAPNITPHPGSGIGTWTDEQIAAAIREGVRPGGKQLYPIMPYLNYNRMTDDDVKAIVAYLRTVKPVDNVVQPNTNLKLPQPETRKPDNLPDPTGDPLKHGEYLVTLMHCNMCHTPTNAEGLPDAKKLYAGGFEMEMPMLGSGKLVGANITSDPTTGIGKWAQTDIEIAMKMLIRPDKTVIQGPMQFYLAGWSQMKDEDLKAIATFIKQIPAIKNKVAKSTFKPNPVGAGSGSAAKPVEAMPPSGGSNSPTMGGGSAAKPGSGGGSAAKPAAGSGSAAKPTAGSGSAKPAMGSGANKT